MTLIELVEERRQQLNVLNMIDSDVEVEDNMDLAHHHMNISNTFHRVTGGSQKLSKVF